MSLRDRNVAGLRNISEQWVDSDFIKALETLRKGGVILYPSDTVWGIGCSATNDKAVRRVYEIKRRAENKSMLVLLDQASKIEKYVQKVPDIAYELIEVSVDPLTIIYPEACDLAGSLVGEDGTIGIRVTNDRFCQSLIRSLRAPLVSTSANFAGEKTPNLFFQIDKELVKMMDYVVEYRQKDTTQAKPSSIIKLSANGAIEVIRK